MSNSANVVDASLESLVAEVADEFMAQLERGERPDIEAYARRHPEHATVLRQVLASLEMVRLSSGSGSPPAMDESGGMTGSLGDYRLVREIGRGGMGIVYEAEQISLGRRVALKVLPFAAALDARQLQRFKNEAQAAAHLQHQNIVPVYAVGCERGVHYYAMQFIDGQTLAQVIADLRMNRSGVEKAAVITSPADGEPSKDAHASEPAGQFSLQPTSPVAALSTERSTSNLAFFHAVARLGIQAAHALENAHQMGIIHRDIKPANLLLEPEASGIPGAGLRLWITDFGLAQVRTDTRLTLTGDLLGTLRYMSPEQALAVRVGVDQRTDIYSLGATLYELSTLEPVFAGIDRQELLRQIAFEEPLPPRRINGAIPAELETIVLKALAKNPDERYASAQEMADDLHRYLKDEPIRARRPSLVQRGRKWARRHQSIVVSGLVAAAVVIAIGLGASVFSYAQISDALEDKTNALIEKTKALGDRTNALGQKEEALIKLGVQQNKTVEALTSETKAKNKLQLALSWNTLALSDREFLLNNVPKADEILESTPQELRLWEWHYLKRLCHKELKVLTVNAPLMDLTYSPDGKWLAGGGTTGVLLVDVHQGKTKLLAGAMTKVNSISFSPDGQHFAALSSFENRVTAYDVVSGKESLNLPVKVHFKSKVRFSPDGKHLAIGAADGTVRVCTVMCGQEVHRLMHGGTSLEVAYNGDGTLLASADHLQKTVKVWDLANGKQRMFRKLPAQISRMAFAPNGKYVALLEQNGLVRVLHAGTGEEFAILGDALGKLEPGISKAGLAFSPDSSLIAVSALKSRSAEVWHVPTATKWYTFRGQTTADNVAFSPDGTRLATSTGGNRVSIWDATTPQEMHSLKATTGRDDFSRFVYSGDGARLAVIRRRKVAGPPSEVKDILLFDARTGRRLTTIARPEDGSPVALALSPNGRLLAVAFHTPKLVKCVKLFDADTGMESRQFLDNVFVNISSLAFSPDGELLAAALGTAGFKVWEAKTGKIVLAQAAPKGIRDNDQGKKSLLIHIVGQVAFAGDGRLAVCASDGTVTLWDVAGKKILRTLPAHRHGVVVAAFHTDGKLLATGGADGLVKVWDVNSGTCLHSLLGHAHGVTSVAYSPDGLRVASGSHDATIKLWDPDNERELLALRGANSMIHALAFTPDGHRLVAWHANTISFFEGTPWGRQPTPLPQLE